MNTNVDSNAERAELIRQRVAQLAEVHSQADISRKTEFSRNNVSRYVSGTRMPMEFGAALVTGLGVNPAWLLAGEGTPYLSDISAGTLKMAGDLLALVEAMAAVNRMRLGSLAGKHHLGVLRDLNETLKDHERLRASLNERSKPILLKLVDDIREALRKRDMNRAESLLQAAEQVTRLTDDLFLQTLLEGTKSQFHHYSNHPEQALVHQRRAFLAHLVSKGEFDEWTRPEAHNYVTVLETTHRLGEARRVARASLEMSDGDHPQLEARAAALDLELGELQRGLDTLRRLIPQVPADYAHNVEQSLARGQLMEGSMTMHQAVHFGRDAQPKWSRLLGWSLAMEDAASLELLLNVGVGEAPAKLPPEHPLAAQAMRLLQVLRDRREVSAQPMPSHLVSTPQKSDALAQFRAHVAFAQILRLGGQRRQALKHTLAAEELTQLAGPAFTPTLDFRVIQARNLLGVADGPPRERAIRFVRDYAARGYHSLRATVAACEKP